LLQKADDNTHLTSGMLLHYLAKLKLQIFADIEEKVNELHFNRLYLCYSSTDCNIFGV